MIKVEDYVPPMGDKIVQHEIAVDTYRRAMHLPYYFFDYFKKTFFIPLYTCSDVSGEQEYGGIHPVYSCYCNNDDYHSLPEIDFDMQVSNPIQFSLNASDYLLLPYINYTDPIDSLCILAMTSYRADDTTALITLGQRFFASFDLMVIYDRTDSTAMVGIGQSRKIDSSTLFKIQITVSIICTVILFCLLLYLIYLKRNRIRAEEWLEVHKDLLFGSTWGSLTEVEILEALVKNKSLADTMAAQVDPAQSGTVATNPSSESGSGSKSEKSNSEDESDESSEESKKGGNLNFHKRTGNNRQSKQLTVVEESDNAESQRGKTKHSMSSQRSLPKNSKKFQSDSDESSDGK